MQVGVDEFPHLFAGRTFPAGIFFFVTCTEYVLGQSQSQSQRAVTGIAGKKLGMADASRLQGGDQPLLDVLVSDDVFKHVLKRGVSGLILCLTL